MVRFIDRPDMILDVYRGRKTTTTQQQQQCSGENRKVRRKNGLKCEICMLITGI